jgi:hypothetical protein
MKKSSFVALVLGTIGTIFSAIGMCMCLLPQWNAFRPGVILGCIGIVVLLITLMVWRKMTNKDPIRVNGKTMGTILLGVIGSLLLGVGMCLVMVWSNLVFGIIVGIMGIMLLLALIPLIKGIEKDEVTQ